MRDECDMILKEKKIKFWDKIMTKVKESGNSRSYYQAVGKFRTKEEAVPWDISDMYPGESNKTVAELVAEFFNRISNEYIPIPDSAIIEPPIQPVSHLQQHEVASRIN